MLFLLLKEQDPSYVSITWCPYCLLGVFVRHDKSSVNEDFVLFWFYHY